MENEEHDVFGNVLGFFCLFLMAVVFIRIIAQFAWGY
jgi:hypothetical protein